MLKFFAPTEIKLEGWLKRQLEIEANGLCGNLDKIWPDVRDSAWIGGDREGWERVPYWLDGFIPLAYLLDNEDMKARAEKYVNAIIKRQKPSGWICPCDEDKIKTYDLWAVFLIGKVLALYHEYTKKRSAFNALYKALKNLYELLKADEVKLFSWAKFRWYECFIPIKYLYDKKHESWLLELAQILKDQGADYGEFEELWKTPMNVWRLDTHIVNICMEMKSEAVVKALFGKSDISAAKRYQLLKKYNGTAVETFTGDECLSGVRNNQGTELCAVNELMYSYEWLYIVTGNTVWLDRLEKIAFNALPATFSVDMWTHQYVQMVNQISAKKFGGKSYFRTNNSEAHIFGLEPNFGCCTANGAQGYPKLATSVFAKQRGAIICTMMLPSTLNTKAFGANISVKIATEYPFRHKASYTVNTDSPAKFKLKIRIPSFSKQVKVNGQFKDFDNYLVIDKIWNGEEKIEIELFDTPHLTGRPYDLNVAEWGALVFALPIKTRWEMIEYEKNGVERRAPYCDYYLHNEGEWRYGFSDDSLQIDFNEGDIYPFSTEHPSVVLKANLAKINWGYEDGYSDVSNHIPASRTALSAPETIELIPYGSTKLRMTEMPMVKFK
ncbi:MAG: glycoside hydrolase family 127 protein [Clostridia bacterium]|nr:glycoside hydrolase family 127 protein [Clostridia bacterium]